MKLVRLLGYLGLLPFVLGVLLEFELVTFGPLWGLKLFAGYSVCILSFLSGAWWGVELKNHFADAVRPLGAILICLLAWVTLLIGSNTLSLMLLTGGFAVVLGGDLTFNAKQYSPAYRSLRIQLSAVVIALHLAMIAKAA